MEGGMMDGRIGRSRGVCVSQPTPPSTQPHMHARDTSRTSSFSPPAVESVVRDE